MDKNMYDVGIIGFWYGMNYGSILTYYALYKSVEKLGLKPILANKPIELWDDSFYGKNTLANRFFAKRCKRSRLRKDYADWIDLNNFCEIFLVGSDIVWKHTLPKRVGYHFFLDFVKREKRKVSYASSFGGEWESNKNITSNVEYFLKRFDFVSVRESEGVEICANCFHVDAVQVMDPVYLPDSEIYYDLVRSSKAHTEGDYIMSYILGPGKSKKDMLLNLQSMMGIGLVNIVGAADEEKGSKYLGLDTSTNLNVEDWLKYIHDCKMYIGDSFHGICFAIIFRKNFILIRNRISPSRCRFDTLLKICGLEDRSIYADEDITARPELLCDIDYNEVYKRLTPKIEFSRKWFENALTSEIERKASDAFDMLNEKMAAVIKENTLMKSRLNKLEEQISKLSGGEQN